MTITSVDGRYPSSSRSIWRLGTRPFTWACRSSQARLLRFAATGTVSGLTQIALLAALLHLGLRAWPANLAAFAAASQANFALSNWFTWGDRRGGVRFTGRWFRFMSTIMLTALVNLGIFTVADGYVPSLLAACAGIAVAAGANFVVADRAVFVASARGAAIPSHRRGG